MKQITIFILILLSSGIQAMFEDKGASSILNVDSIFGVAISESKQALYMRAIQTAEKAIQGDAKRGDVLVFIANVYSWQAKNDFALLFIKKAQAINYKSEDLYESWSNILLRTKQHEELLKVCEEAEQLKFLKTDDLLSKRLIAYTALSQYEKGISLMEVPENKAYLKTKVIDNLYTDLLRKRNTRLITSSYTVDLIDSLAPQHLASIGYSFHFNKTTIGYRANYANRFNRNSMQLEADAYLPLQKDNYFYLNYGYGFNSLLFPNHRFGFEYFQALKQGMEVSLGGRLLKYPNSDVSIITGHLEKYFGKNWVAMRPYFVINKVHAGSSTQQSLSLSGNYRFYDGKATNYWGLEVGFGNSPDNIRTSSQNGGFNQLTAYKLLLERNLMINRVSDLHFGLGYTTESYGVSDRMRSRYTIDIGYKIRIK